MDDERDEEDKHCNTHKEWKKKIIKDAKEGEFMEVSEKERE